ncbi:cytochrome ubiquinol oxidase subunit I [Rubrobacter naiadicus]|uniref:cytochrome ubiquinol oxidase subunit I n=1 Tax=Rubrobacter naiadicus TaxID=1392641 RepID=UPI0023607EF8|nr:cytochrome ubiquinol oxidase subunit I [Rubrobacter naiadicus]
MSAALMSVHPVLALQDTSSTVLLHRWQFGFNLIYHYLYPQLTMGLILLIVVLETLYLRRGHEFYKKAADFWVRLFAPAFVIGAVTGIPLEFGFGTNWAVFSTVSGGVIGQTIALEGVFAFFVESAFLGLYLYGGDAFGKKVRWFSAFMVFLGSWASGYFILTVNAWMQNPISYRTLPDGNLALVHFWKLFLNPWMFHQYIHVMGGAVVTASFAMAGIGAFYLLSRRDVQFGKLFVTLGVIAGLASSLWMIYPSGDMESAALAEKQPIKLAAAEGLFHTEKGASLTIIGQPNLQTMRIDNPIELPKILSFLSYRSFEATVKGLEAFPRSLWPNVPLVYYSYHIMVGLGTIFAAVMLLAALLLWRGRLFRSRRMLWLLLLIMPFPFITNTVGWVVAESGRQPWIIYGVMKTAQGASRLVNAGNVYFTIAGLAGLFLLLSVLYVIVVLKEVHQGPEAPQSEDVERLEKEIREIIPGRRALQERRREEPIESGREEKVRG